MRSRNGLQHVLPEAIRDLSSAAALMATDWAEGPITRQYERSVRARRSSAAEPVPERGAARHLETIAIGETGRMIGYSRSGSYRQPEADPVAGASASPASGPQRGFRSKVGRPVSVLAAKREC